MKQNALVEEDSRRTRSKTGNPIQRRLSPDLIRDRRASLPKITFDKKLPIFQHVAEIQKLLKSHQVVIVAGETGSGKTTQLPLACLKAGLGIRGTIAHTQPRRLAARSVAQRIADQLQVRIGEQVGYSVRFGESWNRRTLVKVMTDGMLLAEVNHDRELRKYEVIIVDEAHERTLNVDFLIGLLRRLVDKRPELKVIVTSATIDVESFSQHFDGAPVVRVEGRSFPVDVEYHPPESGDVESAVFGSIEEILAKDKKGPQDILMFLPTEQEILEWSHRVRRRWSKELEVVPLYARLPPREQQRIFQPSKKQRILMSTNVAETSLTVPNIRYVIDLGQARISRYSARSRVQRLPIEHISQASADQRKGRCGRVAPGTCYRIYDEFVYDRSSPYTDPEIKRTNLASVLLQTKFFRLGDINRFPFLEPPEHRVVNEADRLLHELGAFEDGSLTRLGRQIARIPIDPRYARILIEAAHRNALKEALIIVAALSAQDPRLRPHNQREAADNAHERFDDDRSDFLSLTKIWDWAEKERRARSSSDFKKLIERHYISPSRYFEWRSLHRQLTGYCQRLGFKLNAKPAKYQDLHKAILTGSLGLIGFKESKQGYVGVQDLKFRLFPGSKLSSALPKWIVAAEIVETGRVYARMIASIERRWVEDVAGKLIRISYFDEYWDDRRGQAMQLSRGTLHGLPIYEKRPCLLAPMQPDRARELFVDNVLVEPKSNRDWSFLKHNLQLRTSLLKIQARERRTDIVVSRRVQANFYLDRIPADINDVNGFEAWHSTASGQDIERLQMQRSDLLHRADEDLTNNAFPGSLDLNGHEFPLVYRYAPGDKADGVSVRVRSENIASITSDAIAWLVPGRFAEKCTELLKSLPKQYRRHLVPIPDRVEQLCDFLLRPSRFRVGNFYVVLSETLHNFYKVDIPVDSWDETKLSPFLRMNVQWVNRRGRVVDQDRDLQALKQRHEETLSNTLEDVGASELPATKRLLEFPSSGVPKVMHLKRKQSDFTVFPALVDQQDHVTIEMAVNSEVQKMWHTKGLCRLFLIGNNQSVRYISGEFRKETEMQLQLAKTIDPNELLDSLLMAAARCVYLEDDSELQTKAAFNACINEHRGRLVAVGLDLIKLCCELAQKRFKVSLAIENIQSAVFMRAKEDLERQLANVMPVDFLWQTPFDRLADLLRYLEAMQYRVEHLQGRVSKDEGLMDAAHFWENRLHNLVDKVGLVPELVDVKFLLAEHRVGLFHQRLGTKEKVSNKHLERTFTRLDQLYGGRTA